MVTKGQLVSICLLTKARGDGGRIGAGVKVLRESTVEALVQADGSA